MRTSRLLPAVLAGLVLPPAAEAAGPLPSCSVLTTPCNLSVGLDTAQGINPTPAPDGRRVVFTQQPFGGLVELFSAPATGEVPPTRLSPAGDDVRLIAVTPDSARVVYTQDSALFSVPIAGPASARVRLADDVGTQPQVFVSPDSRKVVFVPPTRDRVRVVPITGPATAGGRLTDPFVPGATARGVRVSADSRSVVYLSDQETRGVLQLYRVPLTLTPAPDPPTARLNGPLVAGGNVAEFTLAPGGGPAIYRADEDADGVFELYRAQLGGGGRGKLSGPLPQGWDVFPPGEDNAPAKVLPDGGRVIYEIGTAAGRVFRELYSVPAAGPASTNVRLDDPGLAGDGEIAAARYALSADSRRVVYTMIDQEPVPELTYLASVPAAGPASAGRLMNVANEDDFVFAISRDSRRVGYLRDDGNLYSTPIAGGTTLRLNGTERPNGFLRAGAGRFAYTALLGTTRGQFSVSVDRSGPRYELTEPLSAGTLSFGRTLTADGRRLLFTAVAAGTAAPVELYSSLLAPAVVLP